jgi:hypothetical protein
MKAFMAPAPRMMEKIAGIEDKTGSRKERTIFQVSG